jgi:hypothetical protein
MIYGNKNSVTFTSPFPLSWVVRRPLLNSRHPSPSLSSLSSSPGSPPPALPLDTFLPLALDGCAGTGGGRVPYFRISADTQSSNRERALVLLIACATASAVISVFSARA